MPIRAPKEKSTRSFATLRNGSYWRQFWRTRLRERFRARWPIRALRRSRSGWVRRARDSDPHRGGKRFRRDRIGKLDQLSAIFERIIALPKMASCGRCKRAVDPTNCGSPAGCEWCKRSDAEEDDAKNAA